MDDVVDVFEDEHGKAYLSYRQMKKERKEFNEDAFRHSTDKQELTPQQAAKPSKAMGRLHTAVPRGGLKSPAAIANCPQPLPLEDRKPDLPKEKEKAEVPEDLTRGGGCLARVLLFTGIYRILHGPLL